MQLPLNSRLKTITNALPPLQGLLDIKALFILDTFSLMFFAMVILGIVEKFPAPTEMVIQTLFMAITILSTILFLIRRAFGMVILKLCMLAIICLMEYHVFFI